MPYLWGLPLLALLVLPMTISSPYVLHVIVLVGYYSAVALSLDIIAGFLGELSFGHAGFLAVGAYTGALLTLKVFTGWWGFWLSLPIGGLMALVMGIAIGIPTLRIKGHYFFIVTMGFGEIVRFILLNWISLTRGPLGLTGIASPQIGTFMFRERSHYYYLILALGLVTLVAVRRLRNSYIGRAWVAIRENDLAAETMGVNLTYYKVLAFLVSAFFAGLAGVFFAHYLNYLHPNNFVALESIMILMMVILGGQGTIWGPIVGAVILVGAQEILRPVAEMRMLFVGVLMVVLMVFRPNGLLGRR
jgi:branched-chain amino acid transport system permease protein